MEAIYSEPRKLIINLMTECRNLSPLSTFFFLTIVSNLISQRKEEAEGEEYDVNFENTYSYNFLLSLSGELTKQANKFAEEQIAVLETFNADKKTVEVLLPVRNFAVSIVL
jgi:hypothetical protein